MDGNGRWAKRRFLPRIAGHRKGVEAVRNIVRACTDRGVQALTLFAFSSENWRRPADEVSLLMQLFVSALQQEVDRLHENGIRFRAIGDISRFDPKLVGLLEGAQKKTAANTGLTLTVAANYGGRWDILQAMRRMFEASPQLRAEPTRASEADLAPYLAMNYAPEPDLFIRTGGEQRISNFMLWQTAYAELYFAATLWPEFKAKQLQDAVHSYLQRDRRFGSSSAVL